MRVRRDEVAADDPAGALDPEPARRPLDLHDAGRGRACTGASQDALVRRRQVARHELRENRQRVDPLERAQHRVGRKNVDERRQDDRALHRLAQAERRLLEQEHCERPGEREREQAADDGAADPVDDSEARDTEDAHLRACR